MQNIHLLSTLLGTRVQSNSSIIHEGDKTIRNTT